jgi:hypothetical protein
MSIWPDLSETSGHCLRFEASFEIITRTVSAGYGSSVESRLPPPTPGGCRASLEARAACGLLCGAGSKVVTGVA